MARPRTHDEALRLRLLSRAGELLSAEGLKSLSLRKLAADTDTSTTAVYSLFGSKTQLLNALCVAGFRRFEKRLKAVGTSGDPVEDFVRLGLAYRESALADPQLYSIMFTNVAPGFEVSPDAALAPLLETVRAAISSGAFVREKPEVIAMSAWGLVHGLISLELNGKLPHSLDAGAAYERSLRAHADGWRQRSSMTDE